MAVDIVVGNTGYSEVVVKFIPKEFWWACCFSRMAAFSKFYFISSLCAPSFFLGDFVSIPLAFLAGDCCWLLLISVPKSLVLTDNLVEGFCVGSLCYYIELLFCELYDTSGNGIY